MESSEHNSTNISPQNANKTDFFIMLFQNYSANPLNFEFFFDVIT